jgi:hypothetical protein
MQGEINYTVGDITYHLEPVIVYCSKLRSSMLTLIRLVSLQPFF